MCHPDGNIWLESVALLKSQEAMRRGESGEFQNFIIDNRVIMTISSWLVSFYLLGYDSIFRNEKKRKRKNIKRKKGKNKKEINNIRAKFSIPGNFFIFIWNVRFIEMDVTWSIVFFKYTIYGLIIVQNYGFASIVFKEEICHIRSFRFAYV